MAETTTPKKKAARCPVCGRPDTKANGEPSTARNRCLCRASFAAAAAVVTPK